MPSKSTSDASITVRLPASLRKAFASACKKAGIPAAQVIRGVVKKYADSAGSYSPKVARTAPAKTSPVKASPAKVSVRYGSDQRSAASQARRSAMFARGAVRRGMYGGK